MPSLKERRARMKREEPEKYAAYLEKQRLKSKASRDAKRAKWLNEPRTLAMEEEHERLLTLARQRNRKAYCKRIGKGEEEVSTTSNRLGDMKPAQRRLHNNRLRAASRARQSAQKRQQVRKADREKKRLKKALLKQTFPVTPPERPLGRLLSGCVALVTGSTGGIGEGIAHCLAAKGANIIVNGFGDKDQIQALVSTLTSTHDVEAIFIDADLSKEEEVENLYTKAVIAFPNGIDILVNNAGFQYVSPLESFPLEVWNQMIAVMLTAPFHLSKLFVGRMKEKGWGRIINIASAHGHVASPNKTAYVTVKHGLVGLTKTIALETAGSGVTCNAVCPGYVETPLFILQADEKAIKQNISYEEGKKQMLEVHPSGETVKIEEVAEAVAFLCSKAASQMTGSSLMMDGGWTAC